MSVTYVKHSKRQVHTSCSECGTDKLYYAHEIDAASADGLPRCVKCDCPNGPLVFVDMDTLKLHACVNPTAAMDTAMAAAVAATLKPDDDIAQPGNDIADVLAAIGITSEQELASAEDAFQDAQTVAFEFTASAEEAVKPFAEDDEYVTHNELNQFNPISYTEAKEAFGNVRDGMTQLGELGLKNGGRIAQLARELIELEKRTRQEIVIYNDGQNPAEGHVISGLSHCQLPDVIRMLSCEHTLLVGGAGAGKGEIAFQAAEALGMRLLKLPGSLSPQSTVSQVIGYMNSSGDYVGTLFRECFENGGLMFFDELDNANPACMAAVNDALALRAGQEIAFPDGMVKRHANFRVLAAANTFGRGPDRTYAARQRGDAATWDRFSILPLKYDEGLEDVLCRQTGLEEGQCVKVTSYIRELRKNVEKHQGTIPVVVGMRASVAICRLLKAGIDPDLAVESRARRGMSDQDWAKISAGVTPLDQLLHPTRPAWGENPSRPRPKPLKPKPLNPQFTAGQLLTGGILDADDLAAAGIGQSIQVLDYQFSEPPKPAYSLIDGAWGSTKPDSFIRATPTDTATVWRDENVFTTPAGSTYEHSVDLKHIRVIYKFQGKDRVTYIPTKVMDLMYEKEFIKAIKEMRSYHQNGSGAMTLLETKEIIDRLKIDIDHLKYANNTQEKP